ncbi:hypothetical protein F8203_gp051 [Heliothis virescens ascovirus 3f]|uniref:Uncharacterized protein n=1 Tax=Heliothis virescens ascovirus 3f TaxID=328614 RepID=A0A171PVD9_9VIRU|nr:hypothetical protein F8203_gp051 [Heliothis virescens ascovirus 3f]AJP09017.1 hypothetical protein [Heliothis virescens ascovirus 3f]
MRSFACLSQRCLILYSRLSASLFVNDSSLRHTSSSSDAPLRHFAPLPEQCVLKRLSTSLEMPVYKFPFFILIMYSL